MKLKSDYKNNVYVWVDDDNDTIEMSPHFDYEEDADLWLSRIKESILPKQVKPKMKFSAAFLEYMVLQDIEGTNQRQAELLHIMDEIISSK